MNRASSLRWKLGVLVVGTSILMSLIATAGLAWRDLRVFQEHSAAEVSAVAAIVADQAGAAVLLDDHAAAREILASLRADDRVSDAVLYTQSAECFAEFHRNVGHGCPARPPDGTRRDHGAIVQSRAVMAGRERAGTLTVCLQLPSAQVLLRRSLPVSASIVAFSMLIAGMLIGALEGRVCSPVLAIARVAQRMAESHRFDERVSIASGDEIGVLARSFNLMLDEIGRRDSELALHRSQLEAEVAERSRVNAELHKAKDKAEAAARLKTEFLANMSHEIRTPMNGIIGMISLVLDRCTEPEEREQLCAAQQAAESLTGILNDILDLSRIEADKLRIESIEFDLRAAIRESLHTFEVAVREKGLHLSVSVASSCPDWVRGDPVRLRQVLVNLIGNAVKFTMEGEVEVAVSSPQAHLLRVEVRDTGIGIPKEKLDVIFEPFTQADGSHTRRFGGSGLGLAITRRLVHLMNGRLWAASEPGLGSRFTVELPLERCEPPAPAESAPALSARPGLRILVAEDNIINQKVVCSMLRRQGWTVTLARDGREACDEFRRGAFDLILMDVQMPEMDGLDATHIIRAEEQRRRIAATPIVALTAHASTAQHEQCLRGGMDAVVTKPVNVADLLATIHAMLDRVPAPV